MRKSIRDAYAYVSALLGARIASVHLMLRVSLQAQAYQREAQMKRCNANVSLQKTSRDSCQVNERPGRQRWLQRSELSLGTEGQYREKRIMESRG